MASFLTSFATGFVSAANRGFDERRVARQKADEAKTKILHGEILPALRAREVEVTTNKKKQTDQDKLLTDLGITPFGRARIASGLGTAENAVDFQKSLTPEQLQQAQGSTFTAAQPAQQSISDFAASFGLTEQDLIERGVDPTQSPGAPGAAPSFTGGPDIGQTGQTPQSKRIQALAGKFVDNPRSFGSTKDLQQAIGAHSRGDYEAVLDLVARSPNLNDTLIPIIEQVLESGLESLTIDQRVTLDLFKPRDPIDQMMNMMVLQNPEFFTQIMDDAISSGIKPPPDNATEEDNIDWMTENIGKLLGIAKGYRNRIFGGTPE